MNTVPTCEGGSEEKPCKCKVTQAAMLQLPQIVVFDGEGNCKTCHHTFGSHPSGTPAITAPGKSLFSFLICLPAPCLLFLPNCVSSPSLLL